MKKTTKMTAVAIVTLSVASAGAAYAAKSRHQHDDMQGKFAVSYIANKLDLDTTQEQALSALRDQILVARNAVKDQMQTTRDDVQKLIEADTFDQAIALELVTSKTATIDTVAPELVGALGHFLDSLDAEQKEDVLAFMHSRSGKHKRGFWRH